MSKIGAKFKKQKGKTVNTGEGGGAKFDPVLGEMLDEKPDEEEEENKEEEEEVVVEKKGTKGKKKK